MVPWLLSGPGSSWNDGSAILVVGCEHAVVSNQMMTWRWDQGSKFGEEIQRREEHGGCAICERVLEFVLNLMVAVDTQSVQAARASRDVAAQAFETLPLLWQADHRGIE